VETYERQLDRDSDWALREGSLHFEECNAVHRTLRKIARHLDELGIPYAVAGAMALFEHGYRRFTEDVDLVVTPEGFQEIHRQLGGSGKGAFWTDRGSLRDADTGVRIDFVVTGTYPGDGKPKPVAFPDPTQAGIERKGLRYLRLSSLLELKIASGMTNPGRLCDLADAQDATAALDLPAEFATQLHPFVRDKYAELWEAVHNNPSEPPEWSH
jgi:hypothetical protein